MPRNPLDRIRFAEGPYEIELSDVREVWVSRDDGAIELKPWFIFQISLSQELSQKVSDFLRYEHQRFVGFEPRLNSEKLIGTAKQYTVLETKDEALPPRLLFIDIDELADLPTELVQSEQYTLRDSVGGIRPDAPRTHNPELKNRLARGSEAVFSPGVLCQIPVFHNNRWGFIFQLAEKNLRVKGQILYKPIGGHLKFTGEFADKASSLKAVSKNRIHPQDENDLAFTLPQENLLKLRHVLQAEMDSGWRSVTNPTDTAKREFIEEIGPEYSSDGISLFSWSDLGLANDPDA